MTVEASAEDAASAPCPQCSAPGPQCSALDPPIPPPHALAPVDPDHPQWVRRRRKLNIMFGSSLATFLGLGIAAIVNMAGGRPIDPNAASVMWPLGSAAAAATGIYVWQGVQRTGWGSGRRGDWRNDWRSGGR